MTSPSTASGIDPRLLRLVREEINSFTKWDVLKFFRDHPDQPETINHVAAYCGREESVVEQAVTELARKGFLIRQHVGGLTVYTQSTKPNKEELISLFLSSCEDPALCVQAIAELVREEQSPSPTPAERRYPPAVVYR